MEFERRGSGHPLFLLHGFCSSCVIWRDLMAELADMRDVIAPDWPGFGRAARAEPLWGACRTMPGRCWRWPTDWASPPSTF
ncbi:MAG: alpha/beta fold hydrolase [Achromobacter sp.]|uniref:alpha/beta fold hydrolase n=1 Tax=Achromobacter sp. TaxID=134375 RepID=UPI003CFEE14A